MSGQFINTGNTPGGKLSLTNNDNAGNLSFSTPGGGGTVYTIGQAALGGIIAYINGGGTSGTSGLVATAADISTGAAWGCVGTTITGASGTAIGTGATNTAAIVAQCGESGIAAKLCDDLVEGGYSDWYLPSLDELNTLCQNKNTIGGFTNQVYWNSSEVSDSQAWGQGFEPLDNCIQLLNSKTYNAYVRAVRSF